MRRLSIVVVLALSGAVGCGSAVSDSSPVADRSERIDAASGAETTRPIVGTLRMRDRDIALTPVALEARGNEVLQEMTARAVWADIDEDHVEPISNDLSATPAALFDRR